MLNVVRQGVTFWQQHNCDFLPPPPPVDPYRDFVPLEQKLLFQVGEKRKTVKIYIVDDDSVEVTENFKLHIQPDNPLSSSTEATVEIIDNDGKHPHMNM